MTAALVPGPGAAGHEHGPACGCAPAGSAFAAPSRRWLQARAVGVLAGLAALSAVVYVRNPLETTVFPPCPFHAATGGWCPGCGATRASYLLFKGRIVDALHYNALWVVLGPVALYQLVAIAAQAFGVTWVRRIPGNRLVTGTILAMIFGFFALRNLPLHALHVLDPPSAS